MQEVSSIQNLIETGAHEMYLIRLPDLVSQVCTTCEAPRLTQPTTHVFCLSAAVHFQMLHFQKDRKTDSILNPWWPCILSGAVRFGGSQTVQAW